MGETRLPESSVRTLTLIPEWLGWLEGCRGRGQPPLAVSERTAPSSVTRHIPREGRERGNQREGGKSRRKREIKMNAVWRTRFV